MLPPTSENRPLRDVLRWLRLIVNKDLESKSSEVQHREVIKELYTRTNMRGSYVAALIFANLIVMLEPDGTNCRMMALEEER